MSLSRPLWLGRWNKMYVIELAYDLHSNHRDESETLPMDV